MERHWIRVAAAAVIVAGTTAPQADAQYAPYRFAQQQSTAAAPPASARAAVPIAVQPRAQQPAYAPYRPQVQQPAGTASQPVARMAAVPQPARVATHYPQVASNYPTVTYPQTTPAYPTTPPYPQTTPAYPQSTTTYPEATYPQTAATDSQFAATTYPQTPATVYPQAVAQNPPYAIYRNVTQQAEELPMGDEDGTLPAPSRTGEPMNGGTANGYNGQSANGASANGAANGHGTMPVENGATMQLHNGHNGYPITSYPGGDAAGANCDDGGYPDYGLGSYFDNPHHDSNWFGGVYWLFMTRDDADFRRFTAMFNTPAGGYPYYPVSDFTVLHSNSVDHDYRSGGEVRFGCTFASGGYDECDTACGTPYGYAYGYDNGCNSCDVQEFAWEFGYWILDDDVNTAEAIDSIPTDTNRMYGMKNFAGLSYNGRDVNDWYDYQMPVTDPAAPGATDVRLLAQRVRSSFRAQNIELNLLRLPLCGSSCGGYGMGHGATDCEPACGSPFSMATLCGFRYMRLDDDFEYATMWATDAGGVLTPPAYTPWDGEGELYYDIEVDNELVGFQLGANMNYCVSCKCNVFWNSSFGMYNNDIEVYQRVYGEFGPATWTQSGADAVVRASKDDVAFAGELLVGTSYNFTCNCRGILAYRAIAISGVGLSVDQIPEDFANEAEVALVDSNGSLIIHGVQVGAEWRY
jgi:hypothetical protein